MTLTKAYAYTLDITGRTEELIMGRAIADPFDGEISVIERMNCAAIDTGAAAGILGGIGRPIPGHGLMKAFHGPVRPRVALWPR